MNIHESMKDILKRFKGKNVRIQVKAGNEFQGTLAEVGDDVLQLTELAGMDYYDAMIRIESVSAVVVKARG